MERSKNKASEKLEKEITLINSRLEKLKIEHSKLVEEVEKSDKSLDNKHLTLKEKEDRIGTLRRQLAELESELEEKRSAIKTL